MHNYLAKESSKHNVNYPAVQLSCSTIILQYNYPAVQLSRSTTILQYNYPAVQLSKQNISHSFWSTNLTSFSPNQNWRGPGACPGGSHGPTKSRHTYGHQTCIHQLLLAHPAQHGGINGESPNSNRQRFMNAATSWKGGGEGGGVGLASLQYTTEYEIIFSRWNIKP